MLSTGSLDAKRVGAPDLNGPLDVACLSQLAREDRTHQFFQFIIAGKPERYHLTGVKGTRLLAYGGGKNLLIAKFFFESNESILHFKRVQSNEKGEHEERQRNDDPPA